MKPKDSLLIILALLCVSASAQSPPLANQTQTVHIQGTIVDPLGGGVPGTKVTFHNDQASQTVIANDKGFYQTDLPVGLYTMTAEGEGPKYRGFGIFRRPLFRVEPATNLTLDAYFNVARFYCDVIQVNTSGAPITAATAAEDSAEGRKDSCGGEDLIPIPSDDGVPFQLYIRYPRRSRSEGNYAYDSEAGNFETLVLVEYNLFTLQARHVVYDAKHRRLEATGAVSVVDESGKTRRADSLAFKIENGRATPLNNHPFTPNPRN
jgi:hypothetical protein